MANVTKVLVRVFGFVVGLHSASPSLHGFSANIFAVAQGMDEGTVWYFLLLVAFSSTRSPL